MDVLRWACHVLAVRPLMFGLFGLVARHGERLPRSGPAIVIANHNSHLDTLALLALFPIRALRVLRPAAASDYFLRGALGAWAARRLLGIVPVHRCRSGRAHPLSECAAALDDGSILIFFPEGTRGQPGRLDRFKPGIARLARSRPGMPIIPVYLTGFDRALPKGAWLPLPFLCEARVGAGRYWTGDCRSFIGELETAVKALAA